MPATSQLAAWSFRAVPVRALARTNGTSAQLVLEHCNDRQVAAGVALCVLQDLADNAE